MNPSPPPVPVPSSELVCGLQTALDRADYRAGSVTALLARPEFAVRPVSRSDRPRLLYRTRDATPLAVLSRLLLLGAPVEFATLQRVCPSAEAWVRHGLLREDGPRVAARFQIVPFGPHWFVTDAPWEYGKQPDAVMPVTNSTAILRQCLINSPAGDVLDLGTGNGVLAVHASKWGDRVVATDVSERAVALTVFNAALNGVSVECRVGRWSEPVAGERFDRVMCNPPFAISPRAEVLFRDSGEHGDALSARLVREAAGLLKPGGFAQVLVNWVHLSGEEPAKRVKDWAAGSGCDAHVLWFQTVSPEDYIGWWLPRTEEASAEEFQSRFDEWIEYLNGLGAVAVSYGLVTLRSRPGRANWCEVDRTPPRAGDCGAAILAEFTRRDVLEEGGEALLRTRLRVAPGVRIEQTASLAGTETSDWWLVQTSGLCRRFPATPLALALIRACQSGRLLSEAIRDIGGSSGDGLLTPATVILPTARELILLGYLEPVAEEWTDFELATGPISVD